LSFFYASTFPRSRPRFSALLFSHRDGVSPPYYPDVIPSIRGRCSFYPEPSGLFLFRNSSAGSRSRVTPSSRPVFFSWNLFLSLRERHERLLSSPFGGSLRQSFLLKGLSLSGFRFAHYTTGFPFSRVHVRECSTFQIPQ